MSELAEAPWSGFIALSEVIPKLEGCSLVVNLPPELGAVVSMRQSQCGRIVCLTESGIPFICPLYPEKFA